MADTEATSWNPADEIDPDIAQKWRLSPRETQVLGALVTVASPTHRLLAQELGISRHTVNAHLTKIREKVRKEGWPAVTALDDLARAYLAEEQSRPLDLGQ